MRARVARGARRRGRRALLPLPLLALMPLRRRLQARTASLVLPTARSATSSRSANGRRDGRHTAQRAEARGEPRKKLTLRRRLARIDIERRGGAARGRSWRRLLLQVHHCGRSLRSPPAARAHAAARTAAAVLADQAALRRLLEVRRADPGRHRDLHRLAARPRRLGLADGDLGAAREGGAGSAPLAEGPASPRRTCARPAARSASLRTRCCSRRTQRAPLPAGQPARAPPDQRAVLCDGRHRDGRAGARGRARAAWKTAGRRAPHWPTSRSSTSRSRCASAPQPTVRRSCRASAAASPPAPPPAAASRRPRRGRSCRSPREREPRRSQF